MYSFSSSFGSCFALIFLANLSDVMNCRVFFPSPPYILLLLLGSLICVCTPNSFLAHRGHKRALDSPGPVIAGAWL